MFDSKRRRAAKAFAVRCGHRFLLMAPLWAGLGAFPASAEDTYRLDASLGSIEFSVRNLGLFTSHGQFRQFTATFVLDPAQPERTRISVDVDAASVDMPWQDGTALLRSADFFNVQHYPSVRFTSTSVATLPAGSYLVSGLLEMRGVTRPIALDATLVGRHFDPVRRADVADFVVTGAVQRSAFGMLADRPFVSDTVAITIHARLQLPAPAHAG
jgi:polyisoprenoid-binding protein YceI